MTYARPLIRYQNSKFHIWHDVSENMCFWDLIAQILHCFFSEVTSHDLQPLMRSQNSKLLIVHNVCLKM